MFNLKKKKATTFTERGKTIMLSLTAVFTGLIIAGTFIRIEIPIIPFTLQTFSVQLTSSMLGPFWGAAAILIWLFMGLVGIPVFTKGGGFTYVLQPTFGYMIGFLIGTIAGGLIINLFKKKNYLSYLSGNIANLLITYACGMIYFYLLQTLYFGKTISAYTVFVSCFLIFLPGDLTFTFVASFIATKLKPIINDLVYQTATDEDIKKYEEEYGKITTESQMDDILDSEITLENTDISTCLEQNIDIACTNTTDIEIN